jgi:hypothetical protein
MLEALATPPAAPTRILLECLEREDAAFDGDTWFFRRLASVGAGPRPLVAPVEGGALPSPPPVGDERAFAITSFTLTGDGRRALAGDADRIELLGIDHWLGGHLRPGHLSRVGPSD